ncbi:MAG: amidase, partial [Pseudodonghicola sp.]
MMQTITELARRLAAGDTTSEALVSQALDRILDPQGEGARAFTMIDPERSLATAREMDALRRAGRAPSPWAGIPISVKCLFDLQGKVTTAGSKVLADAAPAKADAVAISRLRAAGFVIMGHTNMTEFAYSGLGMNPHYGTPGNPADRSRIPGGSSSGAAVSVADGMAAAGIGTDTGGSSRIPAAFCGLVGFKPTARRVPTEGAFPLSQTLDSIGPLARSVADCALLDAIMAGETPAEPVAPAADTLHFAVLDNYVMEGLTPHVAEAFAAAVARLQAAGCRISHITLPDLDRLPGLNAHGGIIAAEALAIHRDLLAAREADYDPRVSVRIRRGETMEPGEYEALLKTRAEIIARADAITAPYDAVLMPTVATEAPKIA